jgi:nucleotide-binding universal stress UspA family protein
MSASTRPVVVGVDGSDAAMGAVRWAAAVAEKLGAPLGLVNGAPGTGRSLTDAANAIWSAALAEHGENATAMLKSTEEEVRATFGDLEVFTLRSDQPTDQLLTARSRTAQLVVLGSEPVSPATALLVGSTTLAVSAHSACPVVVWRGNSPALTNQPILLGVDGPSTGATAFKFAFEFAAVFGVGLKAVHGWSTFLPPVGLLTNPYLMDWDGLEALQWQELLNVLEPWTKLYPDVAVTYFVESEGPGKALLRHAADSQLVVVGSRGRTLLTGTLLGSTGLNLLHHCPSPVMLCHKSTDAR